MTSSSPRLASVWQLRRSTLSGQAFAPLLPFVLAVADEFSRATAAAHRYEQLKRTAWAYDDRAADVARRIFMEFYSDG
jgi:hypothetical protein